MAGVGRARRAGTSHAVRSGGMPIAPFVHPALVSLVSLPPLPSFPPLLGRLLKER